MVVDVIWENDRAVNRFLHKCSVEGLSEIRIKKYKVSFNAIRKLMNPEFKLIDSTQEELERLAYNINQSKYAQNTKYDYRVAIRKFYKVMEGDGEDFPRKTRVFKSMKKAKNSKIPSDMPTEEDIQKLLSVCYDSRSRLIISLLEESGFRAAELLSIKLGDIIFDEYGAKITISKSKTKIRSVRVVKCVRDLLNWIAEHPAGGDPLSPKDPDAPLFIKVQRTTCVHCGKTQREHSRDLLLSFVANRRDVLWSVEHLAKISGLSQRVVKYLLYDKKNSLIKQGVFEKVKDGRYQLKNSEYPFEATCGNFKAKDWEPLNYSALRMLLKTKAKQAGIDSSKIYCHNFRHRRASIVAESGLGEATMCSMFGWAQGSRTPGTYIHMNDSRTDKTVLSELYGYEIKDNKKESIVCGVCGSTNSGDRSLCWNCRRPLSQKTAMEFQKKSKKYGEMFQEIMTGIINGEIDPQELQKISKRIWEGQQEQ